MVDKGVEEEIRKIALKNALDYGKARDGTVLNGVLSKFPELKQKIKELSKAVKLEVERINCLSREEIEKEAGEYKEEFELKEKEKAIRTSKPKMELEGAAEGKFATRFPPAPNGYMHIGHAKAAFMEREFADIYSGNLWLYFDDTNPEMDAQEFVDAFKKDLEWLGIGFDKEYYASDNIEKLYEYAVSLIKSGHAYVCLCDPKTMKENRKEGSECKHRTQKTEKNKELWGNMLEKSGEGILRFKGDMKSPNTVMRDPTLFRIKEESHYRQGRRYRVWPTYDFNTPIMDSLNGVTDALRSKEYELRDELYYVLLDLLKLRKPRVHSFARLDIENNITSKRKLKELIKGGELWGWDDPRLVTIAGLRRRGITSEAIKKFVLRFGLSKTDSKVKIDMLLAENRKIVDKKAKRLFFIEKPFRLRVEGIPKEHLEIKMRLHPNEDLGYRRYKLTGEFFINTYDANTLINGDQVRLKDAFDIRIEKKTDKEITARYLGKQGKEARKLHWVDGGSRVKCKVFRIGELLDGDTFNKESMAVVEGYVEGYANELDEEDVVQFEGIGFHKLDSKKQISFISM